MDDRRLLEEFINGSQDAFRQVVARHIDMVFAAARRQVRDPALAEDVTQAVFIILAKKARKIRQPALTGWLLRATRYCASNARVAESRRKTHEHKAAAMASTKVASPSELADSIAPSLDEAMSRLSEIDRSAIAIRFFQNKTLRDVGESLGISEDAARKRVDRSIDKLRDFYQRRGISSGADVLAATLEAQASEHAPTQLTLAIADAAFGALTSTSLTSSSSLIAKGAMTSMAMAKTKIISVAAIALLLLIFGGIALTVWQSNPRAIVQATTAAPTTMQTIKAEPRNERWNGWQMSALPNPPGTNPPTPPEQFEVYSTAATEKPTFSGIVEGLEPGEKAEVGIVSYIGIPWVNLDNYEWQPVNDDHSFAISAMRHPDVGKALVVRGPNRQWTFLRTIFDGQESAKNIVLRVRSATMVHITMEDPDGKTISNFRLELFPEYQIMNDAGHPIFGQQFGTFTTIDGEIVTPLADRMALLLSTPGLASYYHVVDPGESDHFHFAMRKGVRIEGFVMKKGQPVPDVNVKIVNRAAPLTDALRKTDKDGHFTLDRRMPGDTEFTVMPKGKIQVVNVKDQETDEVVLEAP